MPAEFARAPEVELVARELINNVEEHGQLAEARVLYLFRSGTWNKGGKPVEGDSKVLSGLPQFLSLAEGQTYHLAVIINRGNWLLLAQEQRRALVDHLLCRFIRKTTGRKRLRTRWSTVGPDASEFLSVIRRHGLWAPALKGLGKVVRQVEAQATIEDYRPDGHLKTGTDAAAH